MALINCPECGKEVSDKAEVCIHCGYPFEPIQNENENTVINGVSVDLTNIKKCVGRNEKVKAIQELRNLTGLGLKEAKDYVDNMSVPSVSLNLGVDTTIKCPKCGSTQIQIVPRKWSVMTGLLTNKVDRVCLNCKNKF